MSRTDTNTGSCFCGGVRLVTVGRPVAMGCCHSHSRRHWSASQETALRMFDGLPKPQDVLAHMGGAGIELPR